MSDAFSQRKISYRVGRSVRRGERRGQTAGYETNGSHRDPELVTADYH